VWRITILTINTTRKKLLSYELHYRENKAILVIFN